MLNTIELTKTVPQERWGEFFDQFSDGNRGRHISIEIMNSELGDKELIQNAPLMAIVYDRPGKVYSATKFAVKAISEGMRQESKGEIRLLAQTASRSTNISPGVIATELTSTISDRDTATSTNAYYAKTAIDADAIARAIAYAIEQPLDVDVNEIIIRPTHQI